MVEGYNKNLTSSDSKPTPDRQSSELTTWIRSLQQALTVEVDHGFTNIQGRTNKFSCFSQSCRSGKQNLRAEHGACSRRCPHRWP